jgi:hypothetical protein
MTATKRFPKRVLDEIAAQKYFYLRSGDHRFIAVWVVVVDGRVFVRSWNGKPTGWHAAFLEEPRGHVRLGEKEIPVRAVQTKSEKLRDAVESAYAGKYDTKANAKYVKGFKAKTRRDTTTELTPL